MLVRYMPSGMLGLDPDFMHFPCDFFLCRVGTGVKLRKFILTLHRDGIVKIWDAPWKQFAENHQAPLKKQQGLGPETHGSWPEIFITTTRFQKHSFRKIDLLHLYSMNYLNMICVYVIIYKYIRILQTHTHTHIYIYIYIYIFFFSHTYKNIDTKHGIYIYTHTIHHPFFLPLGNGGPVWEPKKHRVPEPGVA